MRGYLLVLVLFTITINAFGPLCGNSKKGANVFPPPTTMPENLKIAFIGDTGNGEEQRAVLDMITSWGAHGIIHSGDFDYESDPALFEEKINEALGPNYPYFASIGNHDLLRWNGYSKNLEARLARFNATSNCVGDYGVKMTCDWNGLYFVLSGVGVKGLDHPEYMDEAFTNSESIWKVASWHKNQRKMQIGGKFDGTGWGVYETALRHGAIVATGHEHSYCRSYIMTSFQDQVVGNFNETLNIKPGESFVFVSGLGGRSIRDWNERLKDSEWWASVAASNNDVKDGVLMCTFNINGQLEKAHCTFQDTSGKIWDDFDVISHLTKDSKPKRYHQCIPKWLEFPVTKGEDDFQVNLKSGAINCDSEGMEISSKVASVLQFTNVRVPKGSIIKQARLQILGAESDSLNPKINFRAFQPTQSFECKYNTLSSKVQEAINSQSSVFWFDEDEGWEADTVWTSPDLKDLLQEIIDSDSWKEGNTIGLAMSGAGLKNFHSFEKSQCVSPTLQIELETCEDF